MALLRYRFLEGCLLAGWLVGCFCGCFGLWVYVWFGILVLWVACGCRVVRGVLFAGCDCCVIGLGCCFVERSLVGVIVS